MSRTNDLERNQKDPPWKRDAERAAVDAAAALLASDPTTTKTSQFIVLHWSIIAPSIPLNGERVRRIRDAALAKAQKIREDHGR